MEEIKVWDEEKPTYNVLTVNIIYAVRLALIFSAISQLYRIYFFFLFDYYLTMLFDYYWLFYSYQVSMLGVPTMIGYVYISQTFEWMSMIFVITTQKNRRVEEILYDQQNPNSKEVRAYQNKKNGRNNYK